VVICVFAPLIKRLIDIKDSAIVQDILVHTDVY